MIMNFITSHILEVVFSGVATIFAFVGRHYVKLFKYRLERLTEEHDQKIIEQIEQTTCGMTKAIFALEYYRLSRIFTRILDRGYRLEGEIAIIENLYSSYKDLGGNGEIESLYEATKDLPIKTGEIKKGDYLM